MEYEDLPKINKDNFEEKQEILWNKWYNFEENLHKHITSLCSIKNCIQNKTVLNKKEAIKNMREDLARIDELYGQISKMKELAKETIHLSLNLLPKDEK